MAAKLNFIIKTNGTWVQVWQVKNAGIPVDITGYTFELEIKKNRGPSIDSRILNLTIGQGITLVDPVQGKLQLEIAPNPAIIKNETYVYDFVATVGGKRYVWLEGQIVLEPGVSYSGG